MMETKMQTNGMKGLVSGTLAPCLTTKSFFFSWEKELCFCSSESSWITGEGA